MTINTDASLYVLGEDGQTVDGSANDIRGRRVIDVNGERVGKIADLLVDDRERLVRFLVVEHGGFLGLGEQKLLIPVDVVTKISEDEVVVDQSRDRVGAAPGYAPELVDDRTYQSSLYDHYGYVPYWGEGYLYPAGLGFLPSEPPLART